MSEVASFLLEEEMQKTIKLERELIRLQRVARSICDTYVHPDMYVQACDMLYKEPHG